MYSTDQQYTGLVFEDHAEQRKNNLYKTKEENLRLQQLRKEILERERQIKEIENQGIRKDYNEYNQMKVIDEEAQFRLKKNIQNYNVVQENMRKQDELKESINRKSYRDHFLDDIDKKKEIQYDRVLQQRNQNIFRHMKEYQDYIKSISPRNNNTRNTGSKQEEDLYQSVNKPIISVEESFNREKLIKSPIKLLKKVDDSYNKKIADIQNDLKLKQSQSTVFNNRYSNPILDEYKRLQETNLSKSSNFQSLPQINRQESCLSYQSHHNRQIKYLQNVQDNSFIAKMIVKIKSLGVQGMINLYHQFICKDRIGNRTIDYYDFRGIIISIYKIDFSFDDCKNFIQSKGNHINLHKISIKEFLMKISNFNDRRKDYVGKIIKKLDQDQDSYIHFKDELLTYLTNRINLLTNDRHKSIIIELIKYANDFFMMGFSSQIINSLDFSLFTCCLSIMFDSDDEFISYVKFAFELDE